MSQPARSGVPVPTSGMADLESLNREVAAHRHGRVPRELRLEQVLAASAELFADEGPAASMDELARRVGVSKPVVYDLVGSKEQLVALLTDRFADALRSEMVAAVASADDPGDRFRAAARAFFGFVADNRNRWMMLGRTGSSAFGAALDEVRRRQARVVAGLLAEHAGGSSAVPAEVVDLLAHGVNGTFEAMAHWWLERGDRDAMATDEVAAMAEALLLPGLLSLARPDR